MWQPFEFQIFKNSYNLFKIFGFNSFTEDHLWKFQSLFSVAFWRPQLLVSTLSTTYFPFLSIFKNLLSALGLSWLVGFFPQWPKSKAFPLSAVHPRRPKSCTGKCRVLVWPRSPSWTRREVRCASWCDAMPSASARGKASSSRRRMQSCWEVPRTAWSLPPWLLTPPSSAHLLPFLQFVSGSHDFFKEKISVQKHLPMKWYNVWDVASKLCHSKGESG